MWSILLKVLSVIGIVLGGILGVVILLLLLVLLCPIVYKISGKAHEGKYFAKIRLYYLFGLVRAGYTYPEPGNIYAKVAWFTLYDSKKEEADEVASSHSIDAEVTDKDISPKENTTGPTEAKSELEFVDISSDATLDKTEEDNASKGKATEENKDKAAKSGDKKNKSKNPVYYIKRKYYELKHKVIDKIKLLYKDISFYLKLVLHDDTRELIGKVKRQLIKILKQLAPKSGHGNVEFGTGSPDTTAYIFGVYSVVMVKKTKKYVLIPNFEEKIIEGDLVIKGWFNLFGILICALPIVFSKKLKLLRNRIERHSENMDKARRKAEKRFDKEISELDKEYSA